MYLDAVGHSEGRSKGPFGLVGGHLGVGTLATEGQEHFRVGADVLAELPSQLVDADVDDWVQHQRHAGLFSSGGLWCRLLFLFFRLALQEGRVTRAHAQGCGRERR
jgi:hypothetical protein